VCQGSCATEILKTILDKWESDFLQRRDRRRGMEGRQAKNSLE